MIEGERRSKNELTYSFLWSVSSVFSINILTILSRSLFSCKFFIVVKATSILSCFLLVEESSDYSKLAIIPNNIAFKIPPPSIKIELITKSNPYVGPIS